MKKREKPFLKMPAVAGIALIFLVMGACGCPVCKVLPGGEAGVKILNVTNQYEVQKLLESGRSKRMILHFWSTACTVCRPEMEALNNSHRYLDPDKVVLYAITAETRDSAREYAEARSLSVPIVVDQSAIFAGRYKVESLPVTIILSPASAPRRFEGPQEWGSAMREVLER